MSFKIRKAQAYKKEVAVIKSHINNSKLESWQYDDEVFMEMTDDCLNITYMSLSRRAAVKLAKWILKGDK